MNLQVITYNVLFAHDSRVLKSLKNIYKEFRKTPYTFVALQEIRNGTTKSRLQKKVQLIFPEFDSAQNISSTPSLHNLGLMTLSNVKIIDSTPVFLPHINNTFLKPQSLSKKVLPLHGALITRYKISKKILRITNVHFHIMGGLQHKRRQIKHILECHKKQHADLDIICGDFNTIGILPYMNRFLERQLQCIQHELGPTFKQTDPKVWTSDVTSVLSPLTPASHVLHPIIALSHLQFRQKLDWIFYSSNLELNHTHVDFGYKGSDHYPLFGNFKI